MKFKYSTKHCDILFLPCVCVLAPIFIIIHTSVACFDDVINVTSKLLSAFNLVKISAELCK